MKKLLLQISTILFLTLVVGLVAGFFTMSDTLSTSASGVLAGKTGRTVTLEEAFALNQAGEVGFIDARPPQFYRREHIRNAINVPYSVAHDGAEVSALNKEKIWIVYCKGPRCNQGQILVHKLDRAGLKNVYLFPGGMEEWRLAQYPLESTSE